MNSNHRTRERENTTVTCYVGEGEKEQNDAAPSGGMGCAGEGPHHMTTDASARARADGARSATSAFTSDWTAATAASFTAASTATGPSVGGDGTDGDPVGRIVGGTLGASVVGST